MSDHTKISYVDATWPIVAGCQKVSDGCANCSAINDSWRLSHNHNPKVSAPYAHTVRRLSAGNLAWTGVIRPLHDRLTWPLKWKKPRTIFVCNLADLFHPAVPYAFIDQAFAIMALASWHTYLVLTKHPERMLHYFEHHFTRAKCARAAAAFSGRHDGAAGGDAQVSDASFPFPHVVLGSSIENQAMADKRRPPMEALARIGFRTWASYEPAVGPVEWKPWVRFLHAAVAGGESGSLARPMDPAWPRALRDACHAAGVRFHFKQWGPYAPVSRGDDWGSGDVVLYGGKRTGCLLDGVRHNEFPGARP